MKQNDYVMDMNVKYAPLEKISIAEALDRKQGSWYSETLCKVNTSILRLGVFEGEFEMHKHENEDEVFFVLHGSIVLETEKGSFTLNALEGMCVPKGVMHRPIATEEAVVLMVENDGIDIFGGK